MVATAGDERSKGSALAPKCFSLERSRVTVIYSLLARTGDMALPEGKAPGTGQETWAFVGCGTSLSQCLSGGRRE